MALLLSAHLQAAVTTQAHPLTFSSHGLKLAATWHAAEPQPGRILIVQVPGFAQWKDSRSMLLVTSLLTPTADVLSLDMRGNGASEGAYTFGAEEARDVQAAVAALPRSYSRIAFLGMSMGAYISLRAAAEGPLRPWRLLLVSCPTSFEGIASSWAMVAHPFDMLFHKKRHFVVPPQANPYFHWGPMFLEKPSGVDLAPRLSCPVAFLVGYKDSLVFASLSRAVFNAAPEPKTWELWRDGLHAEAMALQHPERFQAWVKRALK